MRPDVVKHLNIYVGPDQVALLFTGERSGKAARRPNFAHRVKWTEVVTNGAQRLAPSRPAARREHLDTTAGTSTKDPMARMGQDDMRAALIYQRATSDADERIVDRLSKLVDEHRKPKSDDDDDPDDGGSGALAPAT